LTVPEATEDRMARAIELIEAQSARELAPPEKMLFDEIPDDSKLRRIATEMSHVPLHQMNFSGYPRASIAQRLIANVVDGLGAIVVVAFSLWLSYWLSTQGIGESAFQNLTRHTKLTTNDLVMVSSFGVAYAIFQYFLLSTSGQTIGKKLTMIRIVCTTGEVAGFVQAVVLRDCACRLLGLIPFFSLINLLVGLGASRRCLHDYIANTRVISHF